MIFTHLQQIYNDMQLNHPNEVADVFEVSFNRHIFRCLFIADSDGRTLFLSSTGENIFTIRLELNQSFEWNGFLGDDYNKLCNYLELQYNPNNRFVPSNFFEELNELFPVTFSANPHPREKAITIHRCYNSEEEKPYFTNWIHWTKKHPSDENIALTASLIGFRDAQRCYNARVSSSWSKNPEDENLAKLNEWVAMIENESI